MKISNTASIYEREIKMCQVVKFHSKTKLPVEPVEQGNYSFVADYRRRLFLLTLIKR